RSGRRLVLRLPAHAPCEVLDRERLELLVPMARPGTDLLPSDFDVLFGGGRRVFAASAEEKGDATEQDWRSAIEHCPERIVSTKSSNTESTENNGGPRFS